MSRNIAVKSALSRRYAGALFALAGKSGAEEAVARDLGAIGAMIEASPSFSKALRNPVIPYAQLEMALAELFALEKISELTCRFCDVLGRNRRLPLLPEIRRAYIALLSASRGEIEAEAVSAAPLAKKDAEALRALLAKATGKTVMVREKLDPGILGGLKVKIGSLLLDASLAGRLEQMRVALKSG